MDAMLLEEMGFWLSLKGVEHHVYRAPWCCHAAWALEHLAASGKNFAVERANTVLVKQGWIRVSQEVFQVHRLGERERRLIARFIRRYPTYEALGSIEIFETKRRRRSIHPVCSFLDAALISAPDMEVQAD